MKRREAPAHHLPRHVFQYWEQGPLSPCLQRVVEANRAANPGWHFHLLNSSDAGPHMVQTTHTVHLPLGALLI